MSDAPERIFIWPYIKGAWDDGGKWFRLLPQYETLDAYEAQYIRADIHAAEVERLRELVEKLRKRVAFYDGVYQPLEYRQSDPE